jgi:opacity protein-like surface antigen
MSGRRTASIAVASAFRRKVSALIAVCMAALVPATGIAQQRRPAPAPARQPLAVRAFGDLGISRFAAGDTFKATLGSSSGVFFGGGVELVLPQQWFVNLRVSHFGKSGERVFVQDDEVFPLGIDMKVGITPIEVSAGYRFGAPGQSRKLIPYLGGGIGWHRYTETSEFADAAENVSETFTGYHVLGGAEYRLGRMFAIAGEAQWTTVPDALSGVSSAGDAFGESNLGGLGLRVRLIVGR